MQVIYAYARDGHQPDDVVDVDEVTGRQLCREGFARRAPAPTVIGEYRYDDGSGLPPGLYATPFGLRRRDLTPVGSADDVPFDGTPTVIDLTPASDSADTTPKENS